MSVEKATERNTFIFQRDFSAKRQHKYFVAEPVLSGYPNQSQHFVT